MVQVSVMVPPRHLTAPPAMTLGMVAESNSQGQDRNVEAVSVTAYERATDVQDQTGGFKIRTATRTGVEGDGEAHP